MKRILGSILVAAAIITVGAAAYEFEAVDSCLDSGGSFNYVAGICDHMKNHPSAPITVHWALALVLGVAGAGLIVLGGRKRNAI